MKLFKCGEVLTVWLLYHFQRYGYLLDHLAQVLKLLALLKQLHRDYLVGFVIQ
ncbi:hypothetical protein D3C80_2222950 [compost metagenome]